MKTSKKVGIVLSGGGFRGVAHVGAIQAIEEAGITPQYVSGTSAGAIVGALYASGHDAENIKKFFKTTSLFKLNRFTRKKPGFLDSEKFSDDFEMFFPENSFESLQKKLFVTTTNLVEGTTTVFSSGPLIKPLLASAAFPGIFSPLLIEGELYADGGILDNFPITPLIDHCDVIIGIDVTPIKKPKISDFKHAYNVMQRAYYLRAMPNAQLMLNKCNIVIQPKELINHGLFSMSDLDRVYNIGYQEAKKQLEIYLDSHEN